MFKTEKLSRINLLAGLLMVFTLAAGATTVDLIPTDDMYSDPNHTYPNEVGELWVANYSGGCGTHYERIMMKFDFEPLGTGADVQSAILHIYRFFRCPNDFYTETDIYAGTQDWDEDSWNCHQHLPHEANPRYSYTFGPNNTWYLIDITTLAQEWVDESLANCGLVIQGKPGEKWSKFYSKDYSNPYLRPYLTVTYEETVGIGEDLYPAGRLQVANYPNPFNPRTTIHYNVPTEDEVTLRIYDSRGKLVCSEDFGRRAEGGHEFVWDAKDRRGESLSAGIYHTLITCGNVSESGKLVLIN